ncbi:MAG TPA: HlyD family type I secretion periplasmic adaptor subunit [Methylophilaceae bacterium]|nr:HlyD family type I secretion periplasmic adaptor subunit [Methylophilaceae bacterium]HAJ71334.1 HlyD family type I secretion periplasmic adaptor subunit [Methylophilaceae bacterium]
MSEGLFKKIGLISKVFGGDSIIAKPIYWMIDKVMPTETRESLAWTEEADLVIAEQSPLKAKKLLYTIFAILIALIIWARFAEIDELARGEGRVVPSNQIQVIQSLDGGIVSEILVKAGDTVKVGTPLIKIDETRAVSSLKENQGQYLALLAKEARLKALANGTAYNPPSAVINEAPQAYHQEQALYEASRQELDSSVNIARDQMIQREKELMELQSKRDFAQKTYESASKELAANKPLLASGAVSEIDILRLDREATRARGEVDQARAQMNRVEVAISEARRKITEAQQSFMSKVRTELNETSTKVSSLTETSVALSDKVKQSTLKSPVNGRVNRLFYNTVGGVIQPGKDVMEVVPSDDRLIIETKVQIRDIAFIRPQQPAVVKLTAYDYTIYGTLDAEVESIAADSTVDDKGNAYYIVRVRTLKTSLGKGLPIIPGMVAQVDIMTGKKTVLKYLLKPVLRAKSYAFTER